MLISRGRLRELAGLPVDIEMTLAGAIDAIGPVEAGVEPLRAVRRTHLVRQHEAMLVEERARILLGGEIATLPAPVGPGAGKALEDLAGIGLAARALVLGEIGKGALIGHGAPQP